MYKLFLCFLFSLVLSGTAQADEIKISNAWVAESSPGQDAASIKLVITTKKNAKIVEVGSGMAEHVEIQSRRVEGATMITSKLSELDLPAKTSVTLGDGENHLMLIGLRQPLVVGRKLPFALTVKFANGKTTLLRILATIKPLNKTVALGSHNSDLADVQ